MAISAEARDTDDLALVSSLGRGEEAALRALHRRYASLVFTAAARIVEPAAADEVVQDVFMTLWKKHDSFDPARGSLRSWLVQIARRRALNELRRKQGRTEEGDGALADLADDALEPDEAQWLAHRKAVIQAAVDALPAAQKQALSLAYFDELTHEQIAATLQMPLGTTKTRIRLALRRLAPALLVVLTATALVLWSRRRDELADRNEQALRMVTASDVIPLRLEPAAGAPPDAHGTYRTRPGARVAVLTTSHLPNAGGVGANEAYFAWTQGPHSWRLLGPVTVQDDGRSLLVVELGPDEAATTELRVTLETAPPGATPKGPTLLGWSASHR